MTRLPTHHSPVRLPGSLAPLAEHVGSAGDVRSSHQARFASSHRALFAALALMSACTQMSTANNNAYFGPNDLVLVDLLDQGQLVGEGNESVNRYLFVTSTNTNELRVVDLKSPTGTAVVRGPLPAPNPLETLSIPVLDRPTSLMIDTRYEAGVRRKGSLLYAMRQGGAELSIVGVEPTELREIRRLPLPAPITSMANLQGADGSHLWVSTFDGANAAIVELALPSSAKGLHARTTASLVNALSTRLRISGSSVVAMLAIPGLPTRAVGGRAFCADPAKACLVVATRPVSGAGGKTVLVDLSTLESVELAFPGPVRALTTSSRVDANDTNPLPGEVVYGTLDEGACGSPACGGLSAVDTRGSVATNFPILSVDGAPTSPLRWSDGLVRGVSIVPKAIVRSTISDGGLATLDLLGVMTMSNGQIIFFDARTVSLIDLDRTPSVLGSGWFLGGEDGGAWLEGPAIESGSATSATLKATISDGALRDQTLSVVWQAELTPPGGLTVGALDTASFSAPGLAARFQVGDRVSFSGTGCAEAAITSVSGDRAVFSPIRSCTANAVTVRAGGQTPFVIVGSADGYLGRAAPGSTFNLQLPRFVREPDVDPSQPALVIPFGTGTDTKPPAPGAAWLFELFSQVVPHVSVVDTSLFNLSTTNCPTQLQLPGAVVYEPVRSRIFAAYPSSNVVVEFDARAAGRGSIGPNEGVTCHR